MAVIIAVCTSKEKGTPKEDVGEARLVQGLGIEGDAHAGFAHRQVSLLSRESADVMRQKGLELENGAFGENFTTAGIDLKSLPVGTELRVGEEALIRVTQIGKECHDRCAIFYKVGDCVMPREGIFTEVIKGGVVRNGDPIQVVKETPEE